MWFETIFWFRITNPNCFFLLFYLNKWLLHKFNFFFIVILIFRMCVIVIGFPILVWYFLIFYLGAMFILVEIVKVILIYYKFQSMILVSLTFQIQNYIYSEHLNFVIFVDVLQFYVMLLFYATNLDVVSLISDLSFLFFANLNSIDIFYNLN